MVMAFPKYFIQVSGIEDPIFPINGAEKIFNTGKQVYDNNNQSEKCILVKGNGGQRFYAKETWPEIKSRI